MHVDDRLATVLDARTEGAAAMRVQYRQLLDLVGTTPAEARGDRLDQAMVRLAELASAIPADERAAAIARAGVRLRSPGLVALLAADAPPVALAAIRTARLDTAQWLDLVPALPLAARGLLRTRKDLGPDFERRLDELGIAERALPAAPANAAQAKAAQPGVAPAPPPPPEPAPEPGPASDGPVPLRPRLSAGAPRATGGAEPAEGISAIVRRIEAFRRTREAAGTPLPANDSPRLPLGEPEGHTRLVQAFRFATDTAGRIGWADAPVAPMVVGLRLSGLDLVEPADLPPPLPSLEDRLSRRQPVRALAVRLEGAPAISGEWQLDAAPDFSEHGHFRGYLGQMRRPAEQPVEAAHPEADRIRQILHELRTPVNAIQGFAEVIQQQLFGPLLHEYRALAAAVAGDAARILAGFAELDRFARLESGVLKPEPGSSDLAALSAGVIHQLESFTAPRSSGFTLTAEGTRLRVAMIAEEAEHLLWRLLATLAGAARPGEVLAVNLSCSAGMARAEFALPASLAALPDPFETSLPPSGQAISAGVFGSGFTLRLAGAEARAAGGALNIGEGQLVLELPECPSPDVNNCLHEEDKSNSSSAA